MKCEIHTHKNTSYTDHTPIIHPQNGGRTKNGTQQHAHWILLTFTGLPLCRCCISISKFPSWFSLYLNFRTGFRGLRSVKTAAREYYNRNLSTRSTSKIANPRSLSRKICQNIPNIYLNISKINKDIPKYTK